jgi:ABC-type lipoprotein release transport system permease subunit
MLMSFIERKRELGALLCLGLRGSMLFRVLILESIFLVILGLVVGTCLGGALTEYFGVVGFSVPGTEEMMQLWHLDAVLYPHVSFRALAYGPGSFFILMLIAAASVAVRVFALDPLSALYGFSGRHGGRK